jgi:hypothetical protein
MSIITGIAEGIIVYMIFLFWYLVLLDTAVFNNYVQVFCQLLIYYLT